MHFRELPLPTYEEATGFITSTTKNLRIKTLKPIDNFNPNYDVSMIHTALLTQNNNLLINIFCNRSRHQLILISQIYCRKNNLSLYNDIKLNFNKNSEFSILLQGLIISYPQFFVDTILKAQSLEWIYYIGFMLSQSEIIDVKNYLQISN